MTQRERFEAWTKKQQPGTLDLTPFDDTYDSDFTSRAWDAWQAAERQALERAALEVEKMVADADQVFGARSELRWFVREYERMAKVIRALNESKKENGDENPA